MRNHPIFKLFQTLLDFPSADKLARGLSHVAPGLGFKALLLLEADFNRQALRPVLDPATPDGGIFKPGPNAAPGAASHGWPIVPLPPSPLLQLWEGNAVVTEGEISGLALRQNICDLAPGYFGTDMESLLADLLPAESGFSPEATLAHLRSIGVDSLFLAPLGGSPIQGVLLAALGGESSRGGTDICDNAAALIDMLGGYIAQTHQVDKLKSLAKESASAGAIALILAQPRLSLEKRLKLALDVILEELNSETGSIMLKKGNQLVVKAATNASILNLVQPIKSKSISATVARTGKVLNIDDIGRQDVSRSPGMLSSYHSQQVLCAPIFYNQRVIGVLNITNRRELLPFQILEESRVVRFVDLIGDLIARADLTEALSRERKRLAQANRELKKLEKLKKDLTNMVIHDLKGPLAEVVANLHLITNEQLTDLAREALESALLGTDELSGMISNLLDISRLQEGRLTIDPEQVNIEERVDRTLNRLKMIMGLKNIRASKQISPETPPISADGKLFDRILQNIVTNAVDHNPEGTEVVFRTFVEGGMVVVSVADHGPGVPEEFREAIFEMFSQLPNRDKPRTSTGLGLTFCKLAVEAHRGRIWVQETEGGGADFRFTLPAARK